MGHGESLPAAGSSGGNDGVLQRRLHTGGVRLSDLACCYPCLPACLQLKELKQELGGLRVAKVTGGAPNKLSKM